MFLVRVQTRLSDVAAQDITPAPVPKTYYALLGTKALLSDLSSLALSCFSLFPILLGETETPLNQAFLALIVYIALPLILIVVTLGLTVKMAPPYLNALVSSFICPRAATSFFISYFGLA